MERHKNNEIEVFGIKIWSPKGIQKVLNQIDYDQESSFEGKINVLNTILIYPGLWDEGNILKFIDVFYGIVRRYSNNSDNRITMQLVWGKFVELRSEQLMGKATLSTERDIHRILESRIVFKSGDAKGLGGVGALSVGK